MNKSRFLTLTLSVPTLILIVALLVGSPDLSTSLPGEEIDRSPSSLALSSDGRRAVTANTTANSVSLIDLTSDRVLQEAPAGRKPFAVTMTRDNRRVAVTNFLSDSITIMEIVRDSLKPIRTIPVGNQPRGIALSADDRTAYVALSGEDSVAAVDIQQMRVLRRVPVDREPWHIGLSPNGRYLVVGNAVGRTVSVLDAKTLTLAYSVPLRGRNLRHIAISLDSQWAYLPHIAERGFSATKENIDMGWVVGSRLSRIPLTGEGPREAITLDPRGKAAGDADGIAVSPDGQTLVVSAGGSQELLILRFPLPFVAFGGPGDHIERELLADSRRFRRVFLGGRPLGIAFLPDGKQVAVANYFGNSLQIVDVEKAQLIRSISVGGPKTPSLARRGEAIFYDARRSFAQWYSCNTCHVEGHTNGGNFDTFNDGSYGTLKKTLSLRGIALTSPYTWHGWQKDLRASVKESLIKSMQGPPPTEDDLDAVIAYLKTLDFPPNPNRNPDGTLSASAKRGERVFQDKQCQSCHAPPLYTSPGAFEVGLEEAGDAYRGFNPPTLRGVYNRAPYLHDGRARTLEETLTIYHRPSLLTGKPDLTPQELSDLIAFLRSL
jgi:DNA-binding beta-propeller fold protein YncE